MLTYIVKVPQLVAQTITNVNGVGEPGALVTVLSPAGKVLGSGQANAQGVFDFAVSKLASGQVYRVVQLDKAGNESAPTEFTFLSTPRITSDYDIASKASGSTTLTVGDDSGGSGNGNIYGVGTALKGSNNDDSVYFNGQVFSNTSIDLGGGNDFLKTGYLSGVAGGEISINMGDGDDVFQLTGDVAGRSAYQARVDMGSGNDKVFLDDNFESDWLRGGSGIDELNFTGSIGTQDFRVLEGFEYINLGDGLGNKLSDVTLSDIIANKPEVPLHILGDSSSEVNLGRQGIIRPLGDDAGGTWSKVGKVTEADGVTYDIWANSSNSDPLTNVYIEQGIQVI